MSNILGPTGLAASFNRTMWNAKAPLPPTPLYLLYWLSACAPYLQPSRAPPQSVAMSTEQRAFSNANQLSLDISKR